MASVSYLPQYTVADYELWAGDWELWDGRAIAMSPSPGIPHQRVASNLHVQIHGLLKGDSCPADCRVLYEIDWRVSAHTVVRPDLLVLSEETDSEWVEKRPEMVVEILSSSTRNKDLTAKRELYAVEGVPIYLVVDPTDESILILELDGEGTYRELNPSDSFELHEGCVLKLDQAALFA
ncbi:MAG: Uma2 family endonuclease [Verrucomicrobiales bacterium]|nr:Uma2 family endonuclease [Verrucomicrobiales bacterium]